MLGLLGAMAIEPVINDASLSVNGVQVGLLEFASVVFQTPPEAAPTYTVLGSEGSAATPDIRPTVDRPPGAVPDVSGAGPIGVQLIVSSNKDDDGTVRGSARTT